MYSAIRYRHYGRNWEYPHNNPFRCTLVRRIREITPNSGPAHGLSRINVILGDIGIVDRNTVGIGRHVREIVVIRSQARKTVFTGGVWEVGDACRGLFFKGIYKYIDVFIQVPNE